ncbi:FadR/GntR family transcriptional regulator [Gimesia aquarii]|uniref:HTH-type transcriptional regulator LutR n=1 Tax=Gimesia aquarii TaxID=2527964 RepID=A0A517VRE8_9PLAN|nr:FCD domain-containing protein [Gimesia aquarii]QDT95595.1 HTH-type transcriptional regulator LutR [Gimesia aquarii]
MSNTFESGNKNMLEPAMSLSAQIAERICERIQDEKLVPGTYLGTVDKLTDQFGVSRTVIREAIGSLRGLGIITGRPKLGLSVAEGDVQSVLRKALIPRTTNKKGWLELAKFRVVIEIGSIPLIIENTTTEQIDRLNLLVAEQKQLLEDQQKDPSRVFEEFIQKDLLFHETLLEAANQDLIAQFHHVLAKYFYQGEAYFPSPTIKMVQEHVEIVKSITDRDSASALQAMNVHLSPILKLIKSKDK